MTESLQETLEVFDEAGEPRTTPEVADCLDLGRRSVYTRLERLVERDQLETKKVGANARVWWRPRTTSEESNGDGAEDGRSWQITRWKQQFRSLIEATEEYAIFMLDRDGYVKTWNPGAKRIKGYETDDILDTHFSTFYTKDDRTNDVPEENLKAAAETGSTQDEGWRLREDGSRFWANVTITAIRDDDGELIGYAKVTRDMTDRREYEQQLLEEKSFIESLLDTQQDLLYAFDTDGEILRWNDRFQKATGYTDAEIEQMQLVDFIADRAADDTTAAIEQVLERGDDVTVELPLVTADGDEIPYEFTGGPLTNESDEIVGITGIGRDISERKARERRLERQRNDFQSELGEIFTRIDEAFFALDNEWRIAYVNDRAAELVQLPVGELMQARVWDVLPEVAEGYPREMAERAIETQESIEFEYYSEMLNIWIEIREYPSETGLSVYVRDITDRKERERELEESRHRYRTLIENFPNGAVTLVDENLHYRAVGGTPLEEADATLEDLEGSPLREILPPDLADVLVQRYEAALAGDASAFEDEIGERSYQFRVLPVRDDDGDVFAALGMSQDITERKERERELELYETIVGTVEDGIYVLDEDFCFTDVNDAYVEMTGYDREELLGTHCSLVVSEDVTADSAEQTQEIAEEGGGSAVIEADIHRADGSRLRAESRFTALPSDDGALQKAGIVRDVSERVAREQELRDRVRQQEVVTDLGQRALQDRDLDVLLAETVELVADTLDTDYCKVLDLDTDAEELLLRQGVGWNKGIVGEATVSAVEDDSQAAYTLVTERPVIVEDLTTESRFSGPALLRNHDVRSGISTIIGPPDNPWGILGTHDTNRREFSEQDATFVQAVANILAAAIERHRHEQELVYQCEQLAALNSLNEVTREIISAVIEQSTRKEIESTVCERLAATDSYLFAWTGDVDPTSQTVNLHTETGVDGYLDGVTISVDPDDEQSERPTGRALRTGEIQVTNDIQTDSRHDPWRGRIEEYGFRSSAAIPIVHEDTVYGVLNVYTERLNAFTGQEREIIAQLGEVVGHAIAAAERKQALMSDELVELGFQIPDVFENSDTTTELGGTITIDHTVALDDGEYLVYGAATPDALDTMSTLVERNPHWVSVTVRSEGDPSSFELRMTDPPVLSVVASHGGYIDRAVIENGDLQMTFHLAPTVDVRQIIDVVKKSYPAAKMIRRRQISRDRNDPHHFQRHFLADLTDRQRTALEVAYHAGFFEWPRDTTGEEVAESIGVTPPTLHQHLRKAERKVFDSVFSSPMQSTG